jgi:putative membrane protein
MNLNYSLFNTSVLGVMVAVSPAYAISTQDFVHTASIANEFEIESSQLALEKSQNDNIKKFAQRMVDDHTKTGEKMKEVLSSTDLKVKPADKLDNKHQKMLDKLKSASNDNFDRQYVSIQNEAHREAVDLFDSYSKSGKDARLKGFASETLPTLKEHLEHVEQLKAN